MTAPTRPTWEEYFFSLARCVAARSTCPRLNVGAVIVRDRQILSVGYNGSATGEPHCCDVGCLIPHGSCIRTIHAETNAIVQAAKHGTAIAGTIMYVTHGPCYNCWKVIRNSGIVEVKFEQAYRHGEWLEGCVDRGDYFSILV